MGSSRDFSRTSSTIRDASTSTLSGSVTSTTSSSGCATTTTSEAWTWPIRRPSLTADFASALRARTESVASAYLSDDDLFVDDDEEAETVAVSSATITSQVVVNECLPPTYHRGEDDYRARKALQEIRRREAMRAMAPKKRNGTADATRRTSKS